MTAGGEEVVRRYGNIADALRERNHVEAELDRAIKEIARLQSALVAAEARIAAMEKVLRAIKTYGELGCVDAGSRWTGGNKPATKDVWQFPRHMLTDIDEALSPVSSHKPETE